VAGPRPVIEAYALTLSVPVKPGAIHRLVVSPEFEIRLIEMLSVEPLLAEAYKRGQQLAKGAIDAKSLGIGSLTGKAIIRAYERTETKPIVGIIASLVPVSVAYGYYEALGRVSPMESLRRIVTSAMYGSPPEEAVSVLDSLEAVSESELVLGLDADGITRSKLERGDISLGDMYEALSRLDLGFSINLRGMQLLSDLRSDIVNASNTVQGILKAYLKLLSRVSGIKPSPESLRALLEADRRIGDRRYNRILGPVAAATALALFSEPLSLPPVG